MFWGLHVPHSSLPVDGRPRDPSTSRGPRLGVQAVKAHREAVAKFCQRLQQMTQMIARILQACVAKSLDAAALTEPEQLQDIVTLLRSAKAEVEVWHRRVHNTARTRYSVFMVR